MTQDKKNEDGSRDNGKHCRFCYRTIHSQATKCVECGGFQNWRRFIAFSGTILSLLVALASVLTVLVPILGDALEESNSDILISPLGYFDYDTFVHLDLFVVNNGQRTGIVLKPHLIDNDADEPCGVHRIIVENNVVEAKNFPIISEENATLLLTITCNTREISLDDAYVVILTKPFVGERKKHVFAIKDFPVNAITSFFGSSFVSHRSARHRLIPRPAGRYRTILHPAANGAYNAVRARVKVLEAAG